MQKSLNDSHLLSSVVLMDLSYTTVRISRFMKVSTDAGRRQEANTGANIRYKAKLLATLYGDSIVGLGFDQRLETTEQRKNAD